MMSAPRDSAREGNHETENELRLVKRPHESIRVRNRVAPRLPGVNPEAGSNAGWVRSAYRAA